MYLKSPRDRYHNDPQFAALVDLLRAHMVSCDFTPSEVRLAAMIASIMQEEYRTRHSAFRFHPSVEKAFDMLEKIETDESVNY